MKFPNRIEQLRQQSGYSRDELARLAGITRQAIGLIEAGKVSPSTVVALRIAKTLAMRVEDLFDDPEQEALVDIVRGSQSVLATGSTTSLLTDNKVAPLRAFVGNVGGNVVARPATETSAANLVRPAHAVVEPLSNSPARGRLRWLQATPSAERTVFVSGCDAGLGLLTEYLPRLNNSGQGVWFEVPNAVALRELTSGHTHIAAIHRMESVGQSERFTENRDGLVEEDIPSEIASKLLRLTFAQAEVGWMVRKGDKRFTGPESLRDHRMRIVNRPVGAGVRKVFDDILQSAGVTPIEVNGYEVEVRGHLAVAQAVAERFADVGLGHAGAAALFGLDFIPVRRETCTLLIPTDYLGHPGVEGLLQTLNSDRFRHELLSFGPYDVSQTGTQRN